MFVGCNTQLITVRWEVDGVVEAYAEEKLQVLVDGMQMVDSVGALMKDMYIGEEVMENGNDLIRRYPMEYQEVTCWESMEKVW